MRRRPASQIRISDNFDNHIESPPKVIRVDVGSEGKDNDGECLNTNYYNEINLFKIMPKHEMIKTRYANFYLNYNLHPNKIWI